MTINESNKRVLVIINPFAGIKKYEQSELSTLLQARGLSPIFTPINELNSDMFEDEHLIDVDCVIVVGGDGSVRSVAGYLIGKKIPLAIIPAGTFNHLASDLEIPNDIEEALTLITRRHLTKIDVAEVNGYFFLNNSSIGLYPKAVKRRDKTFWLAKWLAMTVALINIFKRYPTFNAQYHLENKVYDVMTPLVFVSNNRYELDLFNLSERHRLDEGKLYLYINHCRTRLKFLKLLLDVLLHKRKKALGFFDIKPVEECTLVLKKPNVEVAMDGEIFQLATPLKYQLHRRQLTVISNEKLIK